MQWRTSFDKVTKSFDHVVLQGRTTNWVRYISTTTRPHWTWQGGGLLYCEIDKPLNTWSFEIAWQVKKVLSPLPQCLKPSGWRGPNHIVTWSLKWLCEVTWQTKNIWFIIIPIVTKLVRVLIYSEKLPPLKSYDPLITWSCYFDRLWSQNA